MKRARFITPARREFLAGVAYYRMQDPGLDARFANAVEAAIARAMAFPFSGAPASKDTLFAAFPSRLSIDPRRTAFLSLPWRITHDNQSIGCIVFKRSAPYTKSPLDLKST